MKRALLFLLCAVMSVQIFSTVDISAELFPTLAGLQRTACSEYTDCQENETYLMQADEIKEINGKQYLKYGGVFLREEDSKVLIYSFPYEKDFVLYDWTLEIGDTLQILGIDPFSFPELEYTAVVDYVAFEEYDANGNRTIVKKPLGNKRVKDISTMRLLDGNEYKAWLFGYDWERGKYYVEGIGNASKYGGDYVDLVCPFEVPTCYYGERLVCVSRDGILLYQIDDAEMERLNTECLCDGYQSSYKDQWCDTWNVFVENGSVYPPHEETYRYQLAQDIVIGDYTYTAVVSKAINDALDAPHYVAAVRFTDDRKVYIYYDNAEYLLYDFNVQEGEELEVFAGINNYTSEIKTYKCTVTGVEQYAYVGCPATITLEVHNHPDDFREFYRLTQWIEGVGDINGFLNGINHYVEMDGGGSEYLLCAYKGDELKYTGDLYEEYGCGDDAEQSPEDLFPTLWGLQRTVCNEYCGETEEDNSANFTYKQTFDSIFFENDKPYILCNGYLLREEDNKIFLYSQSLNKDIVLYDFTLEVGDLLPTYIKDFDGTMYSDDTLVVTGISSVTLLDGKKYKKWTFNNGIEYVEAIGMYGGRRNGNFFGLIQEVVVPCHIGTHLVCVSKNGKLLYKMDDAEMERLNTECLCDGYQSSYKDQWCDTWNVLYHGWDPEGGDDPYMPYTFIYQLEEDTTINDLTYQRLTRRFSLSTMPSNKEYIAALRFAENKKVFVHYDNTEYLLYDFGAQVGDTLEIFGGIDYYKDFKTLTHVITEIDSLDDGRLQIYSNAIIQESEGYETPFERLYPKIWIEGVGSKDGIVQNSATNRIGIGPCVLLCAYHNDDCIYTTDNPYYTPYGCVHNDSFFTATEEVNAPTQSVQKILYNGQLLILRDGKTYNIMGMEVTK